MDLSHCYTVLHSASNSSSTATPFITTVHFCRAQINYKPALPSDQVYNNTVSPSCSAAVNYLGCRTSLIFPSLNPWGIFINAQALHQIQSGGLVMRSQVWLDLNAKYRSKPTNDLNILHRLGVMITPYLMSQEKSRGRNEDVCVGVCVFVWEGKRYMGKTGVRAW